MYYFCPCLKFNPHRLQKRTTRKKVQHRVRPVKTLQRQKDRHRDILQGKICKENFKMCLSLSFHNYKIVFKVRISSPIGKKPALGNHESSLNIFLAKLFHARCPCAKRSLSPFSKFDFRHFITF